MIIRKLFKFEAAHIVRNCSTERCKMNIHGHSFTVELKLTASQLDNGGMIVDFGLLKNEIKDLIDSFDHSYILWDRETDSIKDFVKDTNERWVELPLSPSAENLSLFFVFAISRLLETTVFANGEDRPKLHSVTVHETETGYAEAFLEDIEILKYKGTKVSDIFDDAFTSVSNPLFSKSIQEDWKSLDLIEKILGYNRIVNPKVTQQIL